MSNENFLKENNAQHFWHPMAHPAEMKNNPPIIVMLHLNFSIEEDSFKFSSCCRKKKQNS